MEGLQHTARTAVSAVRSTLASMRNRRSAGLDRENGVIASRHTGKHAPSPPVCQRSFFPTDASDETELIRVRHGACAVPSIGLCDWGHVQGVNPAV